MRVYSSHMPGPSVETLDAIAGNNLALMLCTQLWFRPLHGFNLPCKNELIHARVQNVSVLYSLPQN